MQFISLIALAAVIPGVLSRPIISRSLTTRDAASNVAEARSMNEAGPLQERDHDGM